MSKVAPKVIFFILAGTTFRGEFEERVKELMRELEENRNTILFIDELHTIVGAGSSDVYLIITTKPVNSMADLQGLRLRSGGAPYARWAEALGAAPAQVPVSDQFEAMSQGVLDGTMASISCSRRS
jgi:TRAP-type C4-dicarboxylate transport system substrate-binding protein